MMHSYILNGDGGYSVGVWLPGSETHDNTFKRLFDVSSVRAAHRAVNVLNGGEYQTIAIEKEH